MAIIVSSSINKSGSTISGNIPKIVIVRTNAGYAGNPGHAGTGTVVAVFCQSLQASTPGDSRMFLELIGFITAGSPSPVW
jgi:hypothetical protein